MDDHVPHPEQEDAAKQPEYFWNFQGTDYIKPPNRLIFQPISNRGNNQSAQTGDIAVKVRRDGYDFSGWLISLVTFLIVGIYTYDAGGQWQEMIKSTKATRDAANTAACALRQSQEQFAQTSLSNQQQFDETLRQMQAQTIAQAGSAQSAKDAVKAAFQDQRAWMGFNIEVNGPLTFNKDLIPSLSIKTIVANVGRSPALKVKMWTLLVPVAASWPSSEQIDEYCRLMKGPTLSPGTVYAPGESHSDASAAVGRSTDIGKAVKAEGIDGMISVGLIACIDYRTVYDRSKHHQTRKAYQILRLSENKNAVFPPSGSHPVEMHEAPESTAD